MNIRTIKELDVIADEASITGVENVLIEKDGAAKLVPMNMIKASSDGASGGYVIDMTSEEYDITDTAYGDAIKELVTSGVHITIYAENGYYYMPTSIYLSSNTGGPLWIEHSYQGNKIVIQYYKEGSINSIEIAVS